MRSYFKKKVNNFQAAFNYAQKLIVSLDDYKHRLYIVDSRQEAEKKCEIILSYINFQFPIHCVSEMDKKTVHDIANKFAKEFQKQNKYEMCETDQRKIVVHFFNYIVETYGQKKVESN